MSTPTAKWIRQPRYFNTGQPEGYEREDCPKCGGHSLGNGSGGGSFGGSKCSRCHGYGVIYVLQVQPETTDTSGKMAAAQTGEV